MKKYKLLVDNLSMKKLILINGDIATGKSHLANILRDRFNLPLYTKDEFKEKLAESYPYSNYEESHKLSIMAMEQLFTKYEEEAQKGNDVILEANFHEEHLKTLQNLTEKYGYSILDLNLYGSPEILYERYMNRITYENRHPVHRVNNLNDYSYFKEYTLNRQKEALIGEIININCDDFSYQNDESLFLKITNFLEK